MDKKQLRAIRLRIADLLDSPNPDEAEIKRLGKLLGEPDEEAERKCKTRKPRVKYNIGKVKASEYIKMREKGLNMRQIAEHYKITLEQLSAELSKLRRDGELLPGLLRMGREPHITLTLKKYEAYKKRGVTDREISRIEEISTCSLVRLKRNWGLKIGEIPTLTLTKEKYLELQAEGVSNTKIAQMFNTHRSSIYNLRKRWELLG
jgi:transposase